MHCLLRRYLLYSAVVGGLALGASCSGSPLADRPQLPGAVPQAPAPAPSSAGLPDLPRPWDLVSRPADAPTQAHQAAYVEADLILNGADYSLTLPKNHAATVVNDATLDPDWVSPAASSVAGLAYCTYLFTVSGYDRNAQVRLNWTTAPANPSLSWIGLANWHTNTWDWYPDTPTGNITLAGTADYFNPADNLYVIVMETGTDPVQLGAIRLGGPPPVAALGANPTTGAVPLLVHLDASGSTTPEGTITKYEWDFNGDGVYDADGGASATVDHTFTSGGDIDVVVRVTNSFGAADTAGTALQLTGPWVHTLGGVKADDFESMAADSSGNIYAVGYMHVLRISGDVDIMLLTKWSPTGKLLWAKTWDGGFLGAYGHEVQVDSDDNVIVAGQIHVDADVDKALLQKWTPAGSQAWNYEYFNGQRITFTTMSVDGTDLYVAGMGPRTGGASDILVMKIDTTGSPVWESAYDALHGDVGVDSAFRWRFTTGNNELFVLGSTYNANKAPVLLEFHLDGTLVATKSYADGGNNYDPTAVLVTQSSVDLTTNVYVAGNVDNGVTHGIFLTACDDAYNVLRRAVWHGSADAYAGKLLFGNAGDLFLGGVMPGLDAGSQYGMLWRYNTGDFSLLGTEYWADGTQQSSLYNLMWYQGGMLACGVATDASATWGTLTGNSGASTGSWSDINGFNQPINLSVDSAGGNVADLTGATEDTGAGEADGLLMYRGLPSS